MPGRNKNFLITGIIFVVLAAISFALLLLKQPIWLAWAGITFLALGAILIGGYFLSLRNAARPAAKSTPALSEQSAPGSDLLRNAQQSAPQAPLKERQPQGERAFPPDKDQQS